MPRKGGHRRSLVSHVNAMLREEFRWGPGELRPQHLKDMIRISAGEDGRVVLQSLNIFVNFVLAGDVASLA